MFTRLTKCGIDAILLRRQYRCHPVIGSPASDLFYEGRLINGVTEDDRPALVKDWPPIVFFNSCVSDITKLEPEP